MSSTVPIRFSNRKQSRRPYHAQNGYALMVVMFLVALLTIAVAKASLNVVTNSRREKEEEMIWRGRQYVRGIRLFYAKQHRFPTVLDDLYKPKTGLRFMRQAYKDPMNTQDGSWRMIYVGPNGQLIGSLKDRSVNIAGQPTGGFGGAAGQSAFGGQNSGSQNGSSSFFGSSNGFGSASSFGASTGMASSNSANSGASPVQGATAPDGQPADTAGVPNDSLQPHDLSDNPTIIGGNIIGVGSKINKKSIIWFEKAKNYRQYEFVWDPSVDSLTGQRAGLPLNSASPAGNAGGAGAATSPTGTGTNSNPNPTQNPNPSPPPTSSPSPDPGDNTMPLQAPPNP
jgi:hypothetical protein